MTSPSATSISYPDELPITARRPELLTAIQNNQVLIVAGETGSGKSTQLPKLCLELGLGTDGKRIGHTQPRRLAARTIADRIAKELGTQLGETVGYKVRFTDNVKASTRIKLMTDGVLLAETQRDRLLKKYDVIIIDEAHERSLNIDFILGYLQQILPKRPDLKVIITSATIDTQRFSDHFDNAPIIEVSGRTHPVEIRYQPFDPLEPNDRNHSGDRRRSADRNRSNDRSHSNGRNASNASPQALGVKQAVADLWLESEGDILVFCSGEQEIHEALDAVAELHLPNTDLLPLYARLSASEQQRVFNPSQNRRIVASTNVAETSVTVPGVRSVVDAGTARISRYSARTKVQRLPIEAISQASANQRSGRCGRLGPGICIRLYAEEDFLGRDEFTEPEIQRTNLASVILQMTSLRLGKVEDFPFVDPPKPRSIKDGLDLLIELGALKDNGRSDNRRLTGVGKTLAKLPIEPRLGRMLLEADRNGSLKEVLIIVSALAAVDPRERPSDKRQAANEAHRQHENPASDFLTLLNLWKYLKREQKDRSNNQFRKMCRREFLNFLRVREWQSTHKQLNQLCKQLKLRGSSNSAKPDAIHQALLTGLLSQVGSKDVDKNSPGKEKRGRGKPGRKKMVTYTGARNVKFSINPGSALRKDAPQWVMAAELVETSQVWARMVCPVQPEWICDSASHITKHSFADPWWEADRGTAMTKERITLYGLTLVADKRVPLSTWSKQEAREMFIHHALLLNDWEGNHYGFVQQNQNILRYVDELEAQQRQRDTETRNQTLFNFFDQRIGENIANQGDFNGWWKSASQENPAVLDLTVEHFASEHDHDADQFPETWRDPSGDFVLEYTFDPSSVIDGVSVHIPTQRLNDLQPNQFEWSVPGFRNELINQLARTLPKKVRKKLLPMNEAVSWAVTQLSPNGQDLLPQLASVLAQKFSIEIDPTDFDFDTVDPHLRPTFRIINDKNQAIIEGKDLQKLKQDLADHTKSALESVEDQASSIERHGITSWDFGNLPTTRTVSAGGYEARTFPAIVDEGTTVAIRLFATEEEQANAMWNGIRRLLRFQIPSPMRQLDSHISTDTKLWLTAPPIQTKGQWYDDAINGALDHFISQSEYLPTTKKAFDQLSQATQQGFSASIKTMATYVDHFVLTLVSLNSAIEQLQEPKTTTIADVVEHRDRLFYPHFLTGLGYHRLGDAKRYLQALTYRVENLGENPGRDRANTELCQQVETEVFDAIQHQRRHKNLEHLIWQLEELRVSLFAAGAVRPANKVSAKKIRRELQSM